MYAYLIFIFRLPLITLCPVESSGLMHHKYPILPVRCSTVLDALDVTQIAKPNRALVLMHELADLFRHQLLGGE